jgi:tetratricopeptide (TPR) repeat protein
MSARTRVWLIVGGIAVVAAAGTVGLVALTRDHPQKQAAAKAPPLFLYFGVREDAETRALLRARDLYQRGGRAEAGRIFERYDSTEAKVGAALASWPDTLPKLQALPQGKAVVLLHEGIALVATGDQREARRDLEAATRVEPDTPYAVRADDFLHPRSAPGFPFFVPSDPYPSRLTHLRLAAQLKALSRLSSVSGRLHYGFALQRLGKPISARRVFDETVRAAPNDPEALTAAAVARFDKDAPQRAFSRLGPLARRFPRAQTVRFHLGVMLLWIGDVADGKKQLRKAVALGPKSRLGKEAKRFLDHL